MPIKIQFDNNHNAITPTIVLSNRAGQKIGVLNNTCAFNLACNMNSASELTFDIYKELDGVECPYWYQITDFKLIWCREWDKWFQIKVEVSDSGYVKKSITATSLAEAELAQIMLYGIQINTESDIARDDYTKPTVFYNEDDPSISLLNRIMYKAPHYRIKYVDSTLANIQRSFSFDSVSLYDAMQEIAEQVDCLFVFDSGSTTDGKIDRTIAVYDLESNCIDCGYRGEFIDKCPQCDSTNVLNGYGTDTTVFVSTENLAEGIDFSTETGSVKNCFRLTAGDDLMTATIANCNPNGTSYIWYISDQTKKDMPDTLVQKIESYDKLYNEYQTSHEITVSQTDSYNTIAQTYSHSKIESPLVGYKKLIEAIYEATDLYYYLKTSMMPTPQSSDTTATNEANNLRSGLHGLSSVAVTDISVISLATANSAVLAMAKCFVDSRYKVQIAWSVLTGRRWVGSFSITNYSDESDAVSSCGTIPVAITDDYESYVKQMIDKTLNKTNNNSDLDIVSVFKKEGSELKSALEEYSLDSLKSFNDACQSCLDVLIDQGVSDKSAYEGTEVDMYTLVYLPYYEKKQIIEGIIKSRSTEVETVNGMIDTLDRLRSNIQSELDFENYVGTELWQIFCAYRREDTYNNDNYISDGLSNAELVQRAQQFITVAQKEIYKSAELQHSISATMYNLLVMQEFEPLCDYFQIGNWIRVGLDNQVYRLRLLSYAVDFDNLANITVSFSDVTKSGGGLADTESIFKQASSMASSYSSTQRQAEAGATVERTVESWYTDSMSLTNMSIVSDADNQNISLSNHGLVAKEYLPITDEYSDEQLKIINKGLYLTDDNWKTSRAGIGKFKYYNPKTGLKEDAYGVIADTIVGNIVLSKQVGVYNQDGSVVIDTSGVTIDVDGDDPENSAGFKIQKHYTDSSGVKQTEQIFYVNSDGQLVMNGGVRLQIGSSSTDTIGGAISSAQNAASAAQGTLSNLQTGTLNLIAQSSLSISDVDDPPNGANWSLVTFDNYTTLEGTGESIHLVTGSDGYAYSNGVGVKLERAVSKLKPGKTVTFSCYVRGKIGDGNKASVIYYTDMPIASAITGGNFYQQVHGDTLELSETEWKQFAVTLTLPEAYQSATADYFGIVVGLNSEVWMKHIKLEQSDKASVYIPAVEDEADRLAALGTKTETYYSELTSKDGELSSTIGSIKETISDEEKGITAIWTRFSQTDDNISATVGSMETTVKEYADGKVAAFQEKVEKNITFDEDFLTLSASNSENKVNITNEKISFISDTTEAAYISDKKMMITSVEIKSDMTLGNFAFVPRDSGNLSLVRLGG